MWFQHHLLGHLLGGTRIVQCSLHLDQGFPKQTHAHSNARRPVRCSGLFSVPLANSQSNFHQLAGPCDFPVPCSKDRFLCLSFGGGHEATTGIPTGTMTVLHFGCLTMAHAHFSVHSSAGHVTTWRFLIFWIGSLTQPTNISRVAILTTGHKLRALKYSH